MRYRWPLQWVIEWCWEGTRRTIYSQLWALTNHSLLSDFKRRVWWLLAPARLIYTLNKIQSFTFIFHMLLVAPPLAKHVHTDSKCLYSAGVMTPRPPFALNCCFKPHVAFFLPKTPSSSDNFSFIVKITVPETNGTSSRCNAVTRQAFRWEEMQLNIKEIVQ